MREAESAKPTAGPLLGNERPESRAEPLPAAGLPEIDRLVHEPARLLILTMLNAMDSADFLFLLRQTGLTRGNLSSHLSKLEQAGYIRIEKDYLDKIPRTLLHIAPPGRRALRSYRQGMARVLESLPL
jgi:DNA-binding MarR family transcriptional regulator